MFILCSFLIAGFPWQEVLLKTNPKYLLNLNLYLSAALSQIQKQLIIVFWVIILTFRVKLHLGWIFLSLLEERKEDRLGVFGRQQNLRIGGIYFKSLLFMLTSAV